jgi:dTMP kinase
MSGFFITFEGGEGAGKTTQIRRLAERLSSSGWRVTLTREPGGCPSAEAIRDVVKSAPMDAVSETLLFNAARIENLNQTIRPALKRGDVVLCDRFMDSTRAYQMVGAGVPVEVIDTLERWSVGPTRPDLTIVFDLEPEQGLKRAQLRAALDQFEQRGIEYHKRLRTAFLAIAKAEPARCVVVDAAGDEDDVALAIWAAVSPRLTVKA